MSLISERFCSSTDRNIYPSFNDNQRMRCSSVQLAVNMNITTDEHLQIPPRVKLDDKQTLAGWHPSSLSVFGFKCLCFLMHPHHWHSPFMQTLTFNISVAFILIYTCIIMYIIFCDIIRVILQMCLRWTFQLFNVSVWASSDTSLKEPRKWL